MIFTIAKFITGLFGWDISKVQRWLLLAVMVFVVLLVLWFGLWIKSCRDRRSLNASQSQVEKINKANEIERKAELQRVVEQNADTIKTVDNRTTIAQTDADTREAEIRKRVEAADKAIVEARVQGKDVTGPELECLLIPENCKQ